MELVETFKNKCSEPKQFEMMIDIASNPNSNIGKYFGNGNCAILFICEEAEKENIIKMCKYLFDGKKGHFKIFVAHTIDMLVTDACHNEYDIAHILTICIGPLAYIQQNITLFIDLSVMDWFVNVCKRRNIITRSEQNITSYVLGQYVANCDIIPDIYKTKEIYVSSNNAYVLLSGIYYELAKDKLAIYKGTDITNQLQSQMDITNKLRFKTLKIKHINMQPSDFLPRRWVWKYYIGSEKESTCVCCQTTIIDMDTFVRGHILAKYHGGSYCLDNIAPICYACNHDMGVMHMVEYIMQKGYKLHPKLDRFPEITKKYCRPAVL